LIQTVRAFMGLGWTSARRGALVWLGGPVEPRAPFRAERLIVESAQDGRRWGLDMLHPLIEATVIEVDGAAHVARPLPWNLEPGRSYRFGVTWREDGAYLLAAGLYGLWAIEAPVRPAN
jgi:hypothetical protein